MSRNVIEDEANAILAKAGIAFGRFHKNVWYRRRITVETKIKVYRAMSNTDGLPAPCQEAEPLPHDMPQKTLLIKRQDRIPYTDVLTRVGLPSIFTILMQSQLHWAGHIVRMPDYRLPKKLLFGKLQKGKRSQSRQKKRFKDALKASLKAFSISHTTWEWTSQDRDGWRTAFHKGVKSCEVHKISAAE